MNSTRQKLIFISLLVIPFCKAADNDENWNYAVQQHYPDGIEGHVTLNLDHNHITAIPDNLPQQLQLISLVDNEITAIPDNLPQQLQFLYLMHNHIAEIPDNLPQQLKVLRLEGNHITYVDPKIIQQLPRLTNLILNKNPLYQKNVDALREAATAAGQEVIIIADDIGKQYLPDAINIKPAKR